MNEHDEDIRKARLYLTLDADEMANVRAEQAKYERRKAAMQRGDTGSPVVPCESINYPHECGPLHFQPIPCTGCGVKLTSQNHATNQQCEQCRFKAEQRQRFEEAQRKYVESKAKWSVWDWALVLFAAVAVAACVGEAGAMVFWWMGGGN